MANETHVKMIRAGVETFVQWRQHTGTRQIDLSGADLSQLDLKGVNLENANLAGANLEGAILDQANLAFASLEESVLRKAHLEGANFRQANLSSADLSGAVARDADFTQATLNGANLDNANLEKAQLSSARLEGATLRGAHLTNAGLHSANLARADLTDAVAANARFSQAVLRKAVFDRADCRRANFEGARAKGASFVAATLNEASMAGSVLRQTDLRKADLQRADLEYARLQKTKMDGADFFEAKLTGANMAHVSGAAEAKHLDTVTIQMNAPVRYFDSCQRAWPERYASWAIIRTVGNLRLFAVSYSLLVFLLTAFYVVGQYNEKIIIATRWAERVKGSGDKPTELLAEEISSRLDLFLFSLDTVALFAATIVLVIASIIYTLGCPAEIQDFTRPQWCYQLNRSLVHYWSLAWKGRRWRIACSLLYLVGGAAFVPIIGYKLVMAVVYVWKYVDFGLLVQTR